MANVYDIGMRIALTNEVGTALALIITQLTHINTLQGKVNAGFKGMGLAITGVGVALAGAGMLSAFEKFADKGDEYLHQLALMEAQGWKTVEVANAVKAAWATSAAVKSTSPSENIQHLRELSFATGSMADAIDILGPVSQSNAVLNAIKGGGHDEVFNLVKALESKQLTSPEKREEFLSYVNQMTQAIVASGGRVTPQSFQSAFKFGRTAKFGWDEPFVTEILPRLIQEWSSGGGGAGGAGTGGPGNALMSAFSAVVQGKMTAGAAAEWEKLGLLDQSKVERNSKGGIKHLMPGAVIGSQEFQNNPYEFAQSMAAKIIDKYGKNQQVLIEKLSALYGNRTAGAVMAEFVLGGRALLGNQSGFERDRRMKQQAMGPTMAVGMLSEQDPDTVRRNLHAQVDAAEQAMGIPLAKIRIDVMRAMTPFFTSLAQTLHEMDPATLQLVAKGLLALAAGMVAIGVVLAGSVIVAAIGAGGWIAAGFTALAAALALVATAWDSSVLPARVRMIQEVLNGIADAISSFVARIKGLLLAIPDGIKGWLNSDKPIGSPMNYQGDGVGGGMLRGAAWQHPVGNQKPTVLTANMIVDGQTLARIVEEAIAQRNELPDSSSSANGVAYNTINDWNPRA